jgi:GTPase SAR1 family protein
LILGETGVGKSTFINAFINYLVFDSLDDAMKDDNLNYIIPCSFSTQYVDRKSRNGRLVQQEIKIGSSTDERDGSAKMPSYKI